eukprot:31304-Pelagococcus_subviridis.AAC.11
MPIMNVGMSAKNSQYPHDKPSSGMFTKFIPHIPVKNCDGTIITRVVRLLVLVHLHALEDGQTPRNVHVAHVLEILALLLHSLDVRLKRVVPEQVERVLLVRLAQTLHADGEPTHPPQLHSRLVHRLVVRDPLSRHHRVRQDFEEIPELLRERERVVDELVREQREEHRRVRAVFVAHARAVHEKRLQVREVGLDVPVLGDGHDQAHLRHVNERHLVVRHERDVALAVLSVQELHREKRVRAEKTQRRVSVTHHHQTLRRLAALDLRRRELELLAQHVERRGVYSFEMQPSDFGFARFRGGHLANYRPRLRFARRLGHRPGRAVRVVLDVRTVRHRGLRDVAVPRREVRRGHLRERLQLLRLALRRSLDVVQEERFSHGRLHARARPVSHGGLAARLARSRRALHRGGRRRGPRDVCAWIGRRGGGDRQEEVTRNSYFMRTRAIATRFSL